MRSDEVDHARKVSKAASAVRPDDWSRDSCKACHLEHAFEYTPEMRDLNTRLSDEHCAPRLQSWLSDQPETSFAPLFDSTADLLVQSHVRNGKELLRRSPEMEGAVIDLIEAGLKRDDWCGLLYVMCWGTSEEVRPLYIGKANRRGRKADVSANIRDIRRNRHKFARWGDGLDYHIGDLSHTLFGFEAYREPTEKYSRWAEMLFVHRCPPRLRETTSLLLIPWFESSHAIGGDCVDLETAEDQLIDVALAEFEDIVLNVRGEVWWDQRASGTATPPSRHTDRKRTLISDSQALVNAVERLGASARLGLDVETAMYTQELCLIQIADEKETILIDVMSVTDLDRFSGKLSYLAYPEFETDAHPALLRSIKLNMRTQYLECYDYLESPNPPVLHRKETFLADSHPLRERFARLTRQEEKHGLLEDSRSIGTRNGWCHRLSEAGFEVRGHRLYRAKAS